MERIFLLEDDEALGRGVAMALAGPDREVSRAASLAEAKAALAERRFSLLVLDVNLPDGSALDLVRGLRAAGDETPVILLTANKLVGEEVYEYTPNQIKQAITGYGGADKIQMQLMVQALLRLKKVPRPDDAADALAVALCHAHTSRLSTEFKVR